MDQYEPQRDAISALAQLSAIGLEIVSHTGSFNVFQTLNRHMHRLLGVDSFQAYLFDPEILVLRLAFGTAAPSFANDEYIPLTHPTAFAARCARERRRLVIEHEPEDGNGNRKIDGDLECNALFAPMVLGDRLLGIITTKSHRLHRYDDHEKLIFWTLGIYCTLALDNVDTHNQLSATLSNLQDAVGRKLETELACKQFKEASLTDPLTGLRNRRFLQEHIDSDVHLCLRRYEQWSRQPAAPKPLEADLLFFLIDIDHFKQVNDTYSHAAGDMVLVQMRERLQEVTRDYDYLVRWGGEEFLIVARQTDRKNAELIAERIRVAVASRPFELPKGIQLAKTCSVGFACFPYFPERPRMHSWADVMELADRELYKAKSSGRNAWSGLHGTEQQPNGTSPMHLLQQQEQHRDGELQLVHDMNLSAH